MHQSLQTTACTVSAEHAFFFCNSASHHRAVFICDLYKFIYVLHVIILRHKIFAEPFTDIWVNFFLIQLTRIKIFFQQRTVTVYCPHFNCGIFFFKIFTCSYNCSACACCYNQVRNFPFSLFPNFGACLFIMRKPVGKVIILVYVP